MEGFNSVNISFGYGVLFEISGQKSLRLLNDCLKLLMNKALSLGLDINF